MRCIGLVSHQAIVPCLGNNSPSDMNSNVLLTCRGNDNEADEPAAAAEADMDELDRYAAGVEREEVEAATPSGSATSAALGYADPPPVKKQKERPRTKTECKRVVAAEL